MSKVPALAIVLLAIGVGSLFGIAYTSYYYRPPSTNFVTGSQYGQGMMGGWNQQTSTQVPSGSTITMDQAKTIAQQSLASISNPNLALKEIMEFRYNFYVIYYEKDTGRGAFEMIIWKQTPPNGYGMMGGGMMGGRVSPGVIMPEPGPNMMWNTKYSPMANGLMGYRDNYGQSSSSAPLTENQALQYAQSYLNANFQNAKTEMVTQFYGYYTYDFTVNGKVAGMLSVNSYTGQVWYHSWHGAFIQEIEFS
jgi:hypothetical protein